MKACSTILTFCLLAGGCSAFRTNADDAPPPTPARYPTTAPVAEENDVSSVSGLARELFVDLPGRVADLFSSHTPTDAVVAMQDPYHPDRRREGINDLVDRRFGKQAPYTTRYEQIAKFDDDPIVRATAIRALNRSRDGNATPIFIKGLTDPHALVRLESAKALANIPSQEAVQPLIKVVQNTAEDGDIRIAAVDALKYYRTKDVADVLVAQLSDRDFGIAWQARQSLRVMTGADKWYNQTAWNKHIDTHPLG